MQVQPRVYQKSATKLALKGLRGRLKRALVVLATGLGKTLTAAFIMRQFRPRRVLFLVHNNFILDHARGEFKLVFGDRLKMATFNGMSKNGAVEADMVFATWQTMGVNLKKWARDHFDLIIVDEAHHTDAATYLPVVKHFIGAKLGITATPDREDDGDIRKTFGSEVINVSLEEAIARGWLPRIEYHVVTDESLDEEALQKIVAEIRESKRRFTMAEVNRRVFIRKRDREIARIIGGYDEKTIVFCPSVDYAGRMKRFLKLSAVVHSKTGRYQEESWDKNQASLTALKNGTIRRICVVDSVNEGVNVPTVGLLAFCRVTGSIRIFRQQLGRGCRPGKDKLIVLDFVGNLERIQLVMEMMQRISDLHEQYTSQGERDREGYQRQRFEVSGKGFEFTFSDKVVDLMRVLEHCERDFYPTWQEAAAVAISLGMRNQLQYQKNYRKDDRLPANPDATYDDFPGFRVFLGKRAAKPFAKWQEASKAAIRLGISSARQYKDRYREDARLPSTPSSLYPDFPGYPTFFGGRAQDLYPTWKEASDATIQLGISSAREYEQRYKEDSRLPSAPHEKYDNFPGYPRFFGGKPKKFYPTWREASRATIRLGISTVEQYKERRAEDARLPFNPNLMYEDFPGFLVFLGKRAEKLYPTWQEASKAVIRLGISTVHGYERNYKKDKRLPSNPRLEYPDFPGYPTLFGKK